MEASGLLPLQGDWFPGFRGDVGQVDSEFQEESYFLEFRAQGSANVSLGHLRVPDPGEPRVPTSPKPLALRP